jgi:hypothetical protein
MLRTFDFLDLHAAPRLLFPCARRVVQREKEEKGAGERGMKELASVRTFRSARAKTFRSTAVNFGIVVGIISFASLATGCSS